MSGTSVKSLGTFQKEMLFKEPDSNGHKETSVLYFHAFSTKIQANEHCFTCGYNMGTKRT